ncbi:MAG: hypothetical protein MJE77_37155 [Proteobacteria bacterium]|nr:hypothetical protein [Pseudomonadota bacterium]
MSSPDDYLRHFVGGLPAIARSDACALAGLAEQLAELYQKASECWPELAVPAATFLPYVAQRVSLDKPLARALRALHVGDLFLACACVSGSAGAVDAFEAAHRSTMDMALAGMGDVRGVADEARQRVREKLFVAAGGQAPKIASYSGSGDLRSWVRATTIREALSLIRKHQKEVPGEDALLAALPSPGDDPELSKLKEVYRTAFKAAFECAFAGLSSRDRTLLRYKFYDGANIDEIASIYRVHRATAARWIARARAQLFSATRSHMMQHLDFEADDFESVMKLIQSRMEVSISGYLRATERQ